ncbi:MAG: CorA family divalent cation transporter [Acidaminobacteraceae bacterium]
MNENSLIFGYAYNSDREIQILDDFLKETANQSLVWYHLDGSNHLTQDKLLENKIINSLICNELMSEDTRPTIKNYNDGFFITLRCMNYNPESNPEDMVALHIWIKDNLIITVRREKVFAIDDVINYIKAGHKIRNRGDLLIHILSSINDRIGGIIVDIEDKVDELEETLIEGKIENVRSKLTRIRRKIISIRRYIVPQKEVLSKLNFESNLFSDESQGWKIRDSAEKLTRIIEDMDLIRDRASLIHEEINNKIAENMNKTMYALSIVATIFLPLGFLTGLFGINVGGMPGVGNPFAFYILFAVCIVIFIFEYLYFKRNRLF